MNKKISLIPSLPNAFYSVIYLVTECRKNLKTCPNTHKFADVSIRRLKKEICVSIKH